MSAALRSPRFWALLLLLTLYALPRLAQLDNFVNDDERKWLVRSANFYYALAQGDLARTYQREHPGVTVMWAGLLAFAWRYPTYPADAPGYLDWEVEYLEPLLRGQGYDPLALLVASRIMVVLASTTTFGAALHLAWRLLGDQAALMGGALLALGPFHVALSRMLHLDGLAATLALLALLALAAFLYDGGQRRDLLLSAAAAALAWLTKSPLLLLVPFVGLALLWHGGGGWRGRWRALGLWGIAALGVTLLLWPALWVAPLTTVGGVLGGALSKAMEGHDDPTFFLGAIHQGDPGPLFYPVTWLWRTSPLTLVGLLLAAIALVRGGVAARPRRTMALLGSFALLFMAFMTLGSKKFDRYGMPSYPPLELIAGVGWAMAAQALPWRGAGRALQAAVIVGGIALLLPLAPYYYSFYNPLLGGAALAPSTMMIGWGEGLDEAARYLNAKAGAEPLQVASWYALGPFSYFWRGPTPRLLDHDTLETVTPWIETDYVVLYAHQWQRGLPDPAFLAYFAPLVPEKVIRRNGLAYARIYDLRAAPPPDWLAPGKPRFTDWEGAIRLLGYELPTDPLAPGDRFPLLLHLQNVAPVGRDVSVLVRLVDQSGQEWLRDEGWPWGSPTSTWPLGEIWPDGHELVLPATLPPGTYRVLISFYDPATLIPLPATDAWTEEALGTELFLDEILVGTGTTSP